MVDKVLEIKVALIGPSNVGKSSLVKFFKGTNFEVESDTPSAHSNYNETWGIKVNIVEWEYEAYTHCVRLALWESGGSFLKKFPFYQQYLLKDADIVIYMLSLAVEDSIIERL